MPASYLVNKLFTELVKYFINIKRVVDAWTQICRKRLLYSIKSKVIELPSIFVRIENIKFDVHIMRCSPLILLFELFLGIHSYSVISQGFRRASEKIPQTVRK